MQTPEGTGAKVECRSTSGHTPGTCRSVGKQLTEPGRVSDTWAAVDRAVVHAAAVIPFGNLEQHELVGRRLGNTLTHPLPGALIRQMCVH